VHTPQRPRLSWPVRLTVALAAALVSLTGLVGVTTPAHATVFNSCTIARCADARNADAIWASAGYPTQSGWYTWPDGRFNFTGGQFFNREGQLPSGATYFEYDVYSRGLNAPRDAFRIVVNRSAGITWFSPNHYTDFYRL
jgi:ribonuclease T1